MRYRFEILFSVNSDFISVSDSLLVTISAVIVKNKNDCHLAYAHQYFSALGKRYKFFPRLLVLLGVRPGLPGIPVFPVS